ncbi:MAG: T9SS type A sorting domain-containing protein [Bacteroidales bacterium]|jgi:hypothetical protein|nr:T9SS type A sorting domain-containing protein [Bacteroidales bacterium]
MMKNFFLFATIMFSCLVFTGQSVLHYEFNESLSEVNGLGPDLGILGNQGVYVEDTLLEIGSAEKKVYRFEANSGFQFDNAAAGGFLGENYTIELYFVFDYLNSWKRVVDWKNRKTDYGAYVYNGELNFYPYQYSSDAPVNENEYTYYVITRDASSEELLIYTDAVTHISFIDVQDDGLLDNDQVLNFFHDDLVVPNEASSGAVAMLKLYNYTLDSSTIAQHFEDLAGNVFSLDENKSNEVDIKAYPNPVTDHVTLDLSAFEANEILQIRVFNSIGVMVREVHQSVAAGTVRIPMNELESGIYVIHVTNKSSTSHYKILKY